MPITRRRLIAGGAAATAAAALGPLFRDVDVADWTTRPGVAWAAGRTRTMPRPSAERHLLSRTSFGLKPGDPARVKAMGPDTWLNTQLAVGADAAVEATLAPLETLNWTPEQIRTASNELGPRALIRDELVAATLYRMLHSRHQLFEVMVDHWSNHFNVYMDDYHMMMQTVAVRDVLRANALGKFRDLLHGDASSVAMMQYLSTLQNVARGPNENYAREVMELHMLGVEGGYSEADIKAIARCFTGWNRSDASWRFEFRPQDHDAGAKVVLGAPIRATGVDEGREVLDRLVDHPSCPPHVARRLAMRFVADQPPSALIERVAGAWRKDGDIGAMLRVLFSSSEFRDAVVDPDGGGLAKIRRPMWGWRWRAWTSASGTRTSTRSTRARAMPPTGRCSASWAASTRRWPPLPPIWAREWTIRA